jgi:hypothetical protein
MTSQQLTGVKFEDKIKQKVTGFNGALSRQLGIVFCNLQIMF